MSSLPSGIRLVALLNEHLNEIMDRERMNHTSLRSYARKHILRWDETDYVVLTAPESSSTDYRRWHAGEVEGLPQLT